MAKTTLNKGEIAQVVAHYFANNYTGFKGIMSSDKYFWVQGRSGDTRQIGEDKIVKGWGIDVLADTIEKREFFGEWVGESVNQATNCNNAKLIVLKDGDMVHCHFKVKLLENGLFVAAEIIKPKKYLDILRTSEGFVQSARLLGIAGNLEKIASVLYKA